MERDRQRSAVYAAEDQLKSTLAIGGPVDFFGSTIDVPAERRFADLGSIRTYLGAVLALGPVRGRWAAAGAPEVRERAGSRRAHYEPGVPGVIAIPLTGPVEQRWAARESVVLHELAHHLTWSDADAAHGPRFCGCLVHLYHHAIHPSAALLLRAALDSAGAAVIDPEVAA